MASEDIPVEVRQFIFEYIDSAELLHVLLFLRSHPDQEWSSDQINKELRSNSASILNRLNFLKSISLAELKSEDRFIYASGPHDSLIVSLAESFKIRPHAVLELIFSPMKKAKQFANAFMLTPTKKGDSDG